VRESHGSRSGYSDQRYAQRGWSRTGLPLGARAGHADGTVTADFHRSSVAVAPDAQARTRILLLSDRLARALFAGSLRQRKPAIRS
jgi:hypothetical protein